MAARAKLILNRNLAGREFGEYTKVSSLFLTWIDDDKGCWEEIKHLKELFRDRFKFQTQSYRIPSHRSTSRVQHKVAEFVNENGDANNLVIIYYSGQSFINDEPYELVFAAKRKGDGDPTVYCSDITKLLRNLDCDILLVLDCCHAGKAFDTNTMGKRKYELLAACQEDDWTPAPARPGSFTTVMTRKIIQLLNDSKHSAGFTISTLFHHLYHDPSLVTRPVLFELSQFDFGKIWLRPQQQITQPKCTTTLRLTLRGNWHPGDELAIHDIASGLRYLKHIREIEFNGMDSHTNKLPRTVFVIMVIIKWRKRFLKRRQIRLDQAASKNEIVQD